MAVKLIKQQEQHLLTDWDSARRYLRMPTETTRNIYIGPNNLRWDLSGRNKGRQGARLASHVQGDYHLPIDQLFTEGAYEVGATYERTNILKRIINFGVVLGYNCSERQYRAIESNWWDSWPEDTPGWWGRYTPGTGWRWAQVQLAKTVDTTMPLDPTAFNNNGFQWDMQIVAARPWWAKRMLTDSFTAHAESIALNGYDEQTFHIANKATMDAWPKFMYTGPGQCWVQDGMTENMIPLPKLSADDGFVTCDTDPAERTFKGSNDPTDNLFYQFIRQSRVLDFFLHDLESQGLPVWRRANGIRFQSPIPPKTVANLKVRHTEPGGQVIVFMPQRYKRPS
ncbi:hypothetical protein [Mycobacterium intracellulare]|uniref:hypothetical protein n=1 Tax=Mycobacterium intracellulare TaxID=1767 RepID=UPI00080BD66B|nr:hypothetical protein [Mycobacterium intracellulare]OCB15074.1 hypothetical protein A5689_26840 [Mycobacterium intracellulare subsp. yongonense]